MSLQSETTSANGAAANAIHSVAVAIDGKRELAHLIAFAGDADPTAILAKVAKRVERNYPVTGKAFTRRVFEVYRMPGTAPASELVIARDRGEPLGVVEFEPYDGSTEISLGIKKDFRTQYPFEDEVYLTETLDVSEAHHWPTRRVVQTLRRLEDEFWWFFDNSLSFSVGSDAYHSGDAMIREQLCRESRLEMDLFARLRCLCAILIDRGRPELATHGQLFWANREIHRDDHPDLPRWLLGNWDYYDEAVFEQLLRVDAERGEDEDEDEDEYD